jgi:hypothetical protein
LHFVRLYGDHLTVEGHEKNCLVILEA